MYSYLYSIVNWQINFENKYDASWPDCSLAGLFWIWKWFFIRTWIWLNLGVANCKKGRTDLPLFFFLWNRSSETRVHFSSILMIWHFFFNQLPRPFNPKTFHITSTTFIFRENVNCNSILNSYRLYHQCEKKIYILCTYIRIQVPDRKKTLKIQYFCQHIHYIHIHYVYLVYKVAISNYEINKSH